MACLDQLLQVRVAFRVRLEIVPGGDVQGGDAGLAPARREVVHVHASAVGGIEERPQTVAAEGRVQAEIRQRIQQIRKALAAALAGRCGHPEDGTGAALQSGGDGRAGPAFAGEDLRVFRNLEHRQLEPLLPHDGAEPDGAHRLRLCTRTGSFRERPEAEEVGQRGFAFQNQDGATLHAGRATRRWPRLRCAPRKSATLPRAAAGIRWKRGSPARRPRLPRAR